jgi:hypothetical protein
MPDDLRARLETAVAQRLERKPSLKWNLTEEVLARLGWSFRKEREERRDPTVRALCYLVSQLADVSSSFAHVRGQTWVDDPFMFRTFKLAVAKVLDALEPSGQAKSPYASLEPGNLLFETYKTVESAADFTAASVLRPLFYPSPVTQDQKTMLRNLDTPKVPGAGKQLLELMEETFYAMADARRDLGIKSKEPKS